MPGSQITTIAAFDILTSANVTPSGTGSIITALSDATDTTYVGATGTGVMSLAFTGAGIPATAYIQGVRVNYRNHGNPVGSRWTLRENINNGIVQFFTVQSGTITTRQTALFTNLGGETLTGALCDNLQMLIEMNNGDRLYELSIDILWNDRPNLTALSPSGTTGIPLAEFAWTYTDPEGDPQQRATIFIYDAQTVALAGSPSDPPPVTFQPLELIPGKKSYVVNNATPALTINDPITHLPIALPPGDYRWYISALDQGASGKAFAPKWTFEDFTIAVPVPATPEVVAGAYDPIRGRVPLTFQSFDNLLNDIDAGAETLTTEYTLTNCTAIIDTTSTKLWSPPNGPTISAHSLKLTSVGAGDMSAAVPAGQGVQVVPGELVIAGAHVFTWAAPRQCHASIQWTDETATVISTTVGKQIPTALGTAPAIPVAHGICPAGATRAVLIVTVAATGGGEAHSVDDFFISPDVAGGGSACAHWNDNMVANTSFEDYAGSGGASDWQFVTAGAGQAVAVVIEDTVDGARALQIQKAESVLAPPYGEWPDSGNSVPRVVVSAGDVLIVTGYQSRIVGNGVTVEAVYQDGSHDEFPCPANGTGVFEPFIVAFQIPAGKTGVRIRFLPVPTAGSASQGEVHVDAVNIAFATAGNAGIFTALGGTAGTPIGAGLNSTNTAAYQLGTPFQAYYPWIRGGFFANATLYAERSVDEGITWTAVRETATPAIDGTASIYDYEMPPGSTVLYRAREQSIDPVDFAQVVSAGALPIITDPGFATPGVWTGPDLTDTYSNGFQPVFGATVGAITEPSALTPGAFCTSQLGKVPPWATQVRIRFLARTINAHDTTVTIALGDLASASFGASTTTVPASPGDSGWHWYQTAPIQLPRMSSTITAQIFGPAPIDSTQPMLVAFDAFGVSVGDTNDDWSETTTPACVMWLKDPLNPGANVQLDVEANGGAVSSSSTESQLVMQPAGRPDPVVLSDVIGDELLGGLQLVLVNDQQWIAFEHLRDAQRTLLLQLPNGDLVGEQHYIRLGEERDQDRIVTQDQNQTQRRRVRIDAREVAAP